MRDGTNVGCRVGIPGCISKLETAETVVETEVIMVED